MLDDQKLDDDLLGSVAGHGRCTFLLASLIGLIVIYPFGANSRLGEVIFIVMGVIIYVAGIYVIAPKRGQMFFIIGVALAASLFEIVSIYFKSEFLFNLSIIFSTLLYLLIIRHILHYILIRGPITADKLDGATAVFITLAILWAGIYALVENLQPGSFKFPAEQNVGDPWRYYDLLFFSFTSLTTVGYGDIVPVSDQARMLSILEQLVGVFFVAVLIARLAGVYPPHVPRGKRVSPRQEHTR